MTSYIGSHTVIELKESKCYVVILDDLSNSSKVTLERIFKIISTKSTFINTIFPRTTVAFKRKKNVFV